MELMEWMDLKYEAYLSRAQLLKHEQTNIGKYGELDAQVSGLKVLVSDQQMVVDSLKEKLSQLETIEEILENVQRKTGDERRENERHVEEVQMDLSKLKINQYISGLKNI
jgi:hypothetical protein